MTTRLFCSNRRRSVIATAFALALALPAEAQQTRQEDAKAKRQEKAKQLRPYEPGKVEAGLITLEERRFFDRLFNPVTGFYPRLGGMGEGSSFGAGPGYRVLHDRFLFDVNTAVSLKRYWLAETTLSFPELLHGRLFAELYGRYRDYPEVDFFGPGPASLREANTAFGLRDTTISGSGGVRLTRWLAAGGRLEYLIPDIGHGSGRHPSIEERFTDEEAPGLAAQPDSLRTQAFLDLDYREPRGNPRWGGRYLLSYNRYDDRDLEQYDFKRVEVDLQQYFSIFHGHRILALHALVSLSDADAGNRVPFYLQRSLGGSRSLRGFRTNRFRDRNLWFLQAEYRWELNPFLMAALFYDTGTVSHHRRDLSFRKRHEDFGFGLRFGWTTGVVLRTEIAAGSGEGTRYLIRFSNVF